MASAPQPSLLFSFNGSNVDLVTGLSPTTSLGSPEYIPALYKNGIFFNQTGGTVPTQYLSYTLPSGITANNCTVSLWVKPYFTISSSFGNQITLTLNDTETNYQFGMNSATGSPSAPFLYTGGGTIQGGLAVTGTWYHQVAVFSNVGQTGQNSSWTYYFNGGAYIGTQVINRTSTSPMTTLFVGTQTESVASAYVAVQDLRIYNRALTAAQVRGIYQSQGIPPRVTFTSIPASFPTPIYAWPFQGSTVDVINNKDTSASNVAGAYTATNTNQYYPYYDKTGQKAGASSIILNNPTSVVSNVIQYSVSFPLAATSSGAFTLSFWFKWLSPISSGLSGFARLTGSGTGLFTWTFTGGSTQANLGLTNGGGWTGVTVSGSLSNFNISSTGVWYHITLVATSSQMAVYGNGTYLGAYTFTPALTTSTLSPSANTFSSFTLGGNNVSSATNASAIEAADLRMYNGALTASQIQTVYSAGGVYSQVIQPTYMWPFQNSTIDSMQGNDTNTSNVSGGYTSGNQKQLYPYYDKTTPLKTGQSAINFVNFGTTSSNCLEYTGLSAPFGSSNALTVSMWVAANRPWTTTQSIIKLNASSGGMGCGLNYGGASANVFTLGGSAGGGAYNGGAAFTFPTFVNAVVGTFYHLAFIQTGTSIQPFLNGVPGNLITASVDGNAANVYSNYFLAGIPNAPLSLTAATIKVNDLRIYNTALTVSQISSLYSAGGGSLVTTPLTLDALIQPTYMWPFQGSTIDVIQGKDTAQSNVSGVQNVKPYPYYDTTGQKAGASSIIFNNPSGFASNALIYNVTFPINTSGSSLTYSFWFKWITFGGTFFKVYSTTSGGMGGILDGTAGNLQISFNTITGSSIGLLQTTFDISATGVWYHVAVKVQSTGQEIYGNGNLIGRTLYSTPLIQSTSNSIGFVYLSCPNGLGGGVAVTTSNEIADLRFYNTALSATQILAIYQSSGDLYTRATVTQSSGILPTPVYLWPFQGSTVDVIRNKNTTSSNVNGTYNASTNPNQFYPYYDTTTQKAGASSLQLLNVNTATAPSNTLTYSTLSGLPVDNTGNAVTVSFWFKWISPFNFAYSYILSLPFDTGSGPLISTSGGNIAISHASKPGTSITSPIFTTFGIGSTTTWYHITLVSTATQELWYGNGALIGTGTWTNPLTVQGTSNTITGFTLGFTNITQFSSVEIADFRIYNKALNASQIQAIYTSGGIYSQVDGLIQPTYMWPFQGSTIDIVRGLDTAQSNIAGGYTAGNPNQKPWPYYDTTGQKAGQSSIVLNNFGTIASNCIAYSLTNGLSIHQTNAVSYAFWLKFIISSSGSSPIRFFSSLGQTMGAIQQYNGLLQLVFSGAAIPGTTISQINTNFNISSTGVWYHIAVVVTSSGMQVYGNGTLIGTNTYNPPLSIQSTSNTIASFNLSCNGVTNPTFGTGSNELADLRIYNTALNSSQILAIYNSGGVSPSSNFTSGS